MGSREQLWAKYGTAWGWPPATMTYEADKEDLARHEAEIARQETFNYAVLNETDRWKEGKFFRSEITDYHLVTGASR